MCYLSFVHGYTLYLTSIKNEKHMEFCFSLSLPRHAAPKETVLAVSRLEVSLLRLWRRWEGGSSKVCSIFGGDSFFHGGVSSVYDIGSCSDVKRGWVGPGPISAMTARVKDATVEGGSKITWLSIKCNGVQCTSKDATKAVVVVAGG